MDTTFLHTLEKQKKKEGERRKKRRKKNSAYAMVN